MDTTPTLTPKKIAELEPLAKIHPEVKAELARYRELRAQISELEKTLAAAGN